MSTHATIAVLDDAKCRAVYLHCDGYLNWAGAMLYSHYNNDEKAEALISLGSLARLRKRLAPSEGEHHTFDDQLEDVTVAYCRDRDEPLEIQFIEKPDISRDYALMKELSDMSGGCYVYVYDKKEHQWYAGSIAGFIKEEERAFPAAKPKVFYPLAQWLEERQGEYL